MRAKLEAKQSFEEITGNSFCHQWHTVKTTGERKTKMYFIVYVKTLRGVEEEGTLKCTVGKIMLRGSARSKLIVVHACQLHESRPPQPQSKRKHLRITLCPQLNSNVIMDCNLRNVSARTVN